MCFGELIINGLDNGLSPGQRQAIIRTNVGILLIGPLETNSSEILIGIQTFSFMKMHLKMSAIFVLASMCLTICYDSGHWSMQSQPCWKLAPHGAEGLQFSSHRLMIPNISNRTNVQGTEVGSTTNI